MPDDAKAHFVLVFADTSLCNTGYRRGAGTARRLLISISGQTSRHTIAVERFAAHDLTELREDLRQAGLDTWHVAELIRGFLAERGYGVSYDEARRVASSVEIFSGPLHRMQETLEQLAVTM